MLSGGYLSEKNIIIHAVIQSSSYVDNLLQKDSKSIEYLN